jgi:hypothetical protein
MFDTRMIGIPCDPQAPRIEIEMPGGWINVREPPFRMADIGETVLTFVAVLSEVEVRKRNQLFRQRVEESLRKCIEQDGPDSHRVRMDRSELAAADDVDRLVDSLSHGSYLSSWVVIEASTID